MDLPFARATVTVTLDYMDKMHSALTDIWGKANRALTIQFLTCLALIALSTGLASPIEGVVVGGMDLKVIPAVIFVGGAWIVGLLFVYLYALKCREVELKAPIRRQYESLGYPAGWDYQYLRSRMIDEIVVSAVQNGGHAFTAVVGSVSNIIRIAVVHILPLAAIGLAACKAVELYGWAWWVPVAFAPLFVMVIVYVVAAVAKVGK